MVRPRYVRGALLAASLLLASSGASPANRTDHDEPAHDRPSADRASTACRAGADTLATSVTYSGPRGVTIAGLGIRVEYPVTKVAAPAFSPAPGVGNVTNDDGHAFVAEPIKIGGLPAPFMRATFRKCQDAATATPRDFTCTVTDASDDRGNVVEATNVSCTVTVP